MALYEEGRVAWLEKLRNALGGARGAVLLRLREWPAYRGTLGGEAASMMGSAIFIEPPGYSGTGTGCAGRDRLLG